MLKGVIYLIVSSEALNGSLLTFRPSALNIQRIIGLGVAGAVGSAGNGGRKEKKVLKTQFNENNEIFL